MILIVGPLPPPLHGCATITRAVADDLAAQGVPLRVFSNAPAAKARGFAYHASRIRAVLRAGFGVLTVPGGALLYLALAGGKGLLYDIAVIAAARLRGFPVVLHHHSFASFNCPSRLLATLIALAGRDQSHVALCGRMAKRLKTLYPTARRVEIVSNAAFLAHRQAAPVKTTPLRTIGFLSNISPQKGIDRFFDLAAILRQKGWTHPFLVAGPIPDARLKTALEDRAARLGNVHFLGALDGKARDDFLARTDLMVFPTRYVHEAEPLVVLEAHAMGVPVAASDRGCICEMVGPDHGLLLDSEGSDIAALAENIIFWSENPAAFMALRQALERSNAARAKASIAARARFFALLAPRITIPGQPEAPRSPQPSGPSQPG